MSGTNFLCFFARWCFAFGFGATIHVPIPATAEHGRTESAVEEGIVAAGVGGVGVAPDVLRVLKLALKASDVLLLGYSDVCKAKDVLERAARLAETLY